MELKEQQKGDWQRGRLFGSHWTEKPALIAYQQDSLPKKQKVQHLWPLLSMASESDMKGDSGEGPLCELTH